MNIFIKQMTRKWVSTSMLTLLLAFAVGFSCIGCAAWFCTKGQIADIDADYTTIAVPLPQNNEYITQRWLNVGGLPGEDGNIYWSDGTVTYSKENIAAAAAHAPQVTAIENSGILSAGLLNLKGLASGSYDAAQYNEAFDQLNYGFCVLAVKCTYVEDTTVYGYQEGSVRNIGEVSYVADFEIVDCLSLMESYGDLSGKSVRIWGGDSEHCLTEHGGKVPFDAGKTYLVRGFFRDLPYSMQWQKHGEDLEMVPMQAQEDPAGGIVRSLELCARSVYDNRDLSPEEHELEGSEFTYYYTAMEGALPYYAAYTGNPRDFLNTEVGAVWRDVIIPWTQTCQNSAAVILTDNLNAVYNFNTGVAGILEGRAFTQEEYDEGGSVCLISAAFAKHNSLSVGDAVTVDLYDTGTAEYEVHVEGAVSSYYDYVYLRGILTENARIETEKSYTVIGIYTAPEFSDGQYNFTADSIFVPKKSVKNAQRYEEPAIVYLNALVLENGTQADFEAYMTEQGMPGCYAYLDMQFEDTRPVLEAMSDNALRLMVLGAAVFLLVCMVSFYLMQYRMKSVVVGARRIGLSSNAVWKQTVSVFLAFSIAAVILGSILAAAAFGAVTKAVLKTDITVRLYPILLCAGVESLVLIASAALCCRVMSNPRLMQSARRKKGGEQQ